MKQLVENLHRMFIKILCDFNISIKYTTLVLYFSGVIPDFFNKKTKALRDAPTKSGFLHNFSKKNSPGLKNGLERCVSRFSTICAQNELLKLNTDKVTAIRVTQITLRTCIV